VTGDHALRPRNGHRSEASNGIAMSFDWTSLLVPTTPLIELILRGTVMYFALLLALRLLVRRHVGSLSLMDLLLLVLIADAAQNAMAAEYRSITEGLVLCGTLIGWNYLLDFLAFRSKRVARFLEPPPLPLIRNGRLQRRNMRQEFLTEEEVMSQLRQHGIDDLQTVRLAYIEPDGAFSILRSDGKMPDAASQRSEKHTGGI
jgi:uncharacterized membrane protein YcaP (DUF421 family)